MAKAQECEYYTEYFYRRRRRIAEIAEGRRCRQIAESMITKSMQAIAEITEGTTKAFDILSSCGQCSICLINQKHWLRCSNLAGRNVSGNTVERGKWHCPATACLKRWRWEGGSRRILLILDEQEVPSKFKMVVIGDVTTAQEHTITLLKSAQLMFEAHGVVTNTKIPLGRQAIIDAIVKLNKRAEKRILETLPHIWVQTASRQDINKKGLYVYCEDPALSLSEPGLVFNALAVLEDTPSISDEDRQHLLDTRCCFYDFSKNNPSNIGALGDAWNRAQETQYELCPIYWPH